MGVVLETNIERLELQPFPRERLWSLVRDYNQVEVTCLKDSNILTAVGNIDYQGRIETKIRCLPPNLGPYIGKAGLDCHPKGWDDRKRPSKVN